MTRAGKSCTDPRCPNLKPCPVHGRKPWAGSNRRAKTLSGWAQQRRAKRILHRYDEICHVCRKPGADQVDHVICLEEGGPDTEANLRPIHSEPCHREKTQAEAERARRA